VAECVRPFRVGSYLRRSHRVFRPKFSSMLSKDVVPLPPNGERLAGESVDNKENYSLQVSNADGYLCRLQATCHFPVAPATVYAIFVNTGKNHFPEGCRSV
jgi:hypothetical protein